MTGAVAFCGRGNSVFATVVTVVTVVSLRDGKNSKSVKVLASSKLVPEA